MEEDLNWCVRVPLPERELLPDPALRLMSDAAYSMDASTSSMDDTRAEVRRRGLSRRAWPPDDDVDEDEDDCCCSGGGGGSKGRGLLVLERWPSGEGGSLSAADCAPYPYTSLLERRGDDVPREEAEEAAVVTGEAPPLFRPADGA